MQLMAKYRILENKAVKNNIFKLIINAPDIANKAEPGQFVHLRCADCEEMLLRRPFSIHNTVSSVKRQVSSKKQDKKCIEILYRVVGKGTEILAKKKAGDVVDLMGPLGNGFKIPKNISNAMLVAGGMGAAPLMMLAEEMKSVKCQACLADRQVPSVKVLIGAKTKDEILCEKEFRKLGCDVKISTDDGSKGHKGFVSDLLKSLLSTVDCGPSTIYACGPKVMMKKVSEIAKKYKIPAQVSFEENMACGIGACYGCSVETTHGYKLACKDGPVFDADEIIWD